MPKSCRSIKIPKFVMPDMLPLKIFCLCLSANSHLRVFIASLAANSASRSLTEDCLAMFLNSSSLKG